MATSRRVYRVAQKIRGLIALELQRAADPRFFLVTVTSVVVTSDLREAKIYWNVSDPKKRVSDVEKALHAAQGLFRRSLGKELGMKFVPRLKFFYDDTLDTCEEIEQLLQQVGEGPVESNDQ